jgi:rhamnosyltransferase
MGEFAFPLLSGGAELPLHATHDFDRRMANSDSALRRAPLMTGHSVCAIVVTHHPPKAAIDNLAVTYSQVDGMVVVDNGSNPDTIDQLRAASRAVGFDLIENGDNLGPAESLNRGARWAINRGFAWTIFFDEDSKITEHFIERMLETYQEAQIPNKVAVVAPTYVEAEAGVKGELLRSRRGEILATMSSGSLIPTRIFQDELPPLDASFFIDYFDIDFCLRQRSRGMSILQSPAELLHSLGRSSYHRFLGITFCSTNHTAGRRYYITRNRLVVMRRYAHDFPWLWRESRAFVSELAKIILVEKDKAAKLRAVATGIADAITGKKGKRVPL